MPPRLYRVILPVSDIATGVEFYARLLQLPGERISPGRHYFDLGGTILAVYDPVADGDPLGDGWRCHPFQYIYIGVDDLGTAFERARQAGATLLTREIETMPWGERAIYARDPSGNPFCLVDNRTLFIGGGWQSGPPRSQGHVDPID
jgi:predicted enzyme related to lactoylglutathione lyase